MSENKPRGYWQDWDNFERELREVTEEQDHFPLQRELNDMKRSDILNAATKYYGGLNAVRERMGYRDSNVNASGKRSRTPQGYVNVNEVIGKTPLRLKAIRELVNLGIFRDLLNSQRKGRGTAYYVREDVSSEDLLGIIKGFHSMVKHGEAYRTTSENEQILEKASKIPQLGGSPTSPYESTTGKIEEVDETHIDRMNNLQIVVSGLAKKLRDLEDEVDRRIDSLQVSIEGDTNLYRRDVEEAISTLPHFREEITFITTPDAENIMGLRYVIEGTNTKQSEFVGNLIGLKAKVAKDQFSQLMGWMNQRTLSPEAYEYSVRCLSHLSTKEFEVSLERLVGVITPEREDEIPDRIFSVKPVKAEKAAKKNERPFSIAES